MTLPRRLLRYLVLPLAAVTFAIVLPALAILTLFYIAIWWVLIACGVLLLIVFYPWERHMGTRNSGRGKRITVTGGPFTFRTLHPPAETSSKLAAEGTIDKSITLTMPAIDGAEHLVVPTRRIRL